MRIKKSVIDIINDSVTGLAQETGGILGSSDNILIDEIVMDIVDSENTRPCSYFPNVDFLNQNIQSWKKKGIAFKGIFHTHFVGVKTLSQGDREYIRAIMNAMPLSVDSLYFPVFVLPNRVLIGYRAKKRNGKIEISGEEIFIEI